MLQERALMRSIVAGMINVGQEATTAMVTAPARSAGAAEATATAGQYSSVDEVLVDIVDRGTERLSRVLGAVGLVRRRSATDSLKLGLAALWDDVEAHVDEYRALTILRITRPDLMVAGPAGALPLSEMPQIWAVRWLTELTRVQDLTWNKPVPLLARLLVATLKGLITDIACRPAVEDTRRLFEVFAYTLAQHSTRHHRPRSPTA